MQQVRNHFIYSLMDLLTHSRTLLFIAGVLLQRSLRVNKTSKKLWLKYYEVELWGVAKLAEREKVLGISDEMNEITASGPAMVVFKHGIKAIHDVDFALTFYMIAQNIAIELAKNIEQELVRVYGRDGRFWELMINHKITQKLQVTRKRKFDGGEQDNLIDTLQYAHRTLVDAKAILGDDAAGAQQYASLVLHCTNHILGSVCSYFGSFNAVDVDTKRLSSSLGSLISLGKLAANVDTKHGILYTTIQFRGWLLATALSLTISADALVNYDSFTRFIDEVTVKLDKISVDEVRLWHEMIELLLDTTVKLNVLQPKTLLDCSKSIKLLMSKAVVVINQEVGMNLFLRVVDYVLARGDVPLIINTLKSLIKSRSCNEATRGHLCYIYLRLNACTTQSSSSSVLIEEIKAALTWIESTVTMTPSLHIHSGLLSFYRRVSSLLMEVNTQIRSDNASNKAYYTFTKAFFDKATSIFPKEEELWDRYIEFERLYENHQVANHLSWKKSTL